MTQDSPNCRTTIPNEISIILWPLHHRRPLDIRVIRTAKHSLSTLTSLEPQNRIQITHYRCGVAIDTLLVRGSQRIKQPQIVISNTRKAPFITSYSFPEAKTEKQETSQDYGASLNQHTEFEILTYMLLDHSIRGIRLSTRDKASMSGTTTCRFIIFYQLYMYLKSICMQRTRLIREMERNNKK